MAVPRRRTPLLWLTCAVSALVAAPGPATGPAGGTTTVRAAPPRSQGELLGTNLDGHDHAVPCGALEELANADGTRDCTHGDDNGLGENRPGRYAETATAAYQASSDVACFGDGVSGKRVQLLYVRTADRPSRLASARSYLVSLAGQMQERVTASAARTGGSRYIRFVTDADCQVQIPEVVIPIGSDRSFTAMKAAVVAGGYAAANRSYLLISDAESVYCGIAELEPDATPGPANRSNLIPRYARIDYRAPGGEACWTPNVALHELFHTFGAVQPGSPNATPYGHCTDELDILCYSDGPGIVIKNVCLSAFNGFLASDLLDCGNDDYFSTNPPPGSYLATHWNTANSAYLSPVAQVDDRAFGAYRPVTPSRILDTRIQFKAPPASGVTFVKTVVGEGGVPIDGVGAVVLNVTVVSPTAAGYLTVAPDEGTGLPGVSNLNYRPGQVVPNLVVVQVPSSGRLRIFSSAGSPHVIIDVQGWFADASGRETARGTFHPLDPIRLLDTRPSPPVGRNSWIGVQIAGVAGIPESHVAAVALNVTAVGATAATYITVWPSGDAQPYTSNLNVESPSPIANFVISGVGADGKIAMANFDGSVHLLADVAGWFDDGDPSVTPGSVFYPVPPTRVFDSRSGSPVGAAASVDVAIAGSGGIPSGPDASAVVANLTTVDASADTYLTAWPLSAAQPNASNINVSKGQTTPNLSITRLDNGGIRLFNFAGSAHQLVDVAGYFGPARSAAVTQQTAPGTVNDLSVALLNNYADVRWSAPTFGGNSPILRYEVTEFPSGRTSVAAAQDLHALFIGLSAGHTYSYSVVAVNAAGRSLPAVTASVLYGPVPSTTANFTVIASPGDATISVDWSRVSYTGAPITGYVVKNYDTGEFRDYPATATGGHVPAVNGSAPDVLVMALQTNGYIGWYEYPNRVSPRPPGVPEPVLYLRGRAGTTPGTVRLDWLGPLWDGGSPVTSISVTELAGGVTTVLPAPVTLPLTLSGLTSGASVGFSVHAVNANGPGPDTSSNIVLVP
jgi:Fibronectin type III domain